MDNHERDMEPPPKGLGSHPRHTSEDSDLMQIPRKPGRSERVVSHETPFLLVIKRLCQIDRVHGLPSVAVSAFFPREKDNWVVWKTKDNKWRRELQ